ncbi:MAG TPA: PilN domain-containing protein [Gemmatimonadaceae bacterium]|jgi:Tfp pilus assembly protein PilN|nr:PilN domain-containing protein [Gemmatimonadaceae bacterium]
MIEINLLPGAGKKRAATRQAIDFGALTAGVTSRLRDRWLIAAIVCAVVGVGAVGFLYLSQKSREEALTARQQLAQRDSTRYANFLKDRYQSEAARDAVLRQVNIIKTLDEDRYVWPHVMDEVSRALPQYTWLTSLGFTGTPQGGNNIVVNPKAAADTGKGAKNKPPKRIDTNVPKDVIQIKLSGRTVDIQAMTRFMRDLEASPFLGNVQIDKSELAVDQGKEVTQFQLSFGYTRPDTTILHRVPMSISVR